MSEGYAALDAMIARVRSLGTLAADVAREAAPLVLAAAQRTANAGTDPYGKPWAKKIDGSQALAKAADAITAVAVGAAVVVTLTGINVFHNYGVKGGSPQRQIIPDAGRGIPDGISAAIQKAAQRVFARKTGAA